MTDQPTGSEAAAEPHPLCFHLGETGKQHEGKPPFGFLATVITGRSAEGKPLHKALGKVLAAGSAEPSFGPIMALLELLAQRESFWRELHQTSAIWRPQFFSGEQAYRLLATADTLRDLGIELKLPAAWRGRKPAKVSLNIQVSAQAEDDKGSGSVPWLKFNPRLLHPDGSVADLEQLPEQDGLIRLKGQWVSVSRDKLAELHDNWQQLIALQRQGVPLTTALNWLARWSADRQTAELGLEDQALADPTDDQQDVTIDIGPALLPILRPLLEPEGAALPDAATTALKQVFRADLRPYQQVGVAWLYQLYRHGLGGILADDMGLGKTVQVLALLTICRALPAADGQPHPPVLLVVPTSLLSNWQRECKKFAPHLQVGVFHPSHDSSNSRGATPLAHPPPDFRVGAGDVTASGHAASKGGQQPPIRGATPLGHPPADFPAGACDVTDGGDLPTMGSATSDSPALRGATPLGHPPADFPAGACDVTDGGDFPTMGSATSDSPALRGSTPLAHPPPDFPVMAGDVTTGGDHLPMGSTTSDALNPRGATPLAHPPPDFPVMAGDVTPGAHAAGKGGQQPPIRGATPEGWQKNDLIITSYGMLKSRPELRAEKYQMVICDEAQALKNPTTAAHAAVQQLQGGPKFLLTGTPIENSLSDLWALMDICARPLLGTWPQFRDRLDELAKDAMPLQKLIKPFLLRRLKSDPKIIGDLPAKIYRQVLCPLSDKQQALYQDELNAWKAHAAATEGSPQTRGGHILTTLLHLRQICNHPAQFLKDGDYKAADSGKFFRLAQLARTIAARGEKMLVFTAYRELTGELARLLAQVFGREGLVLHGGTSAPERGEMVAAFQQPDGPPFFVLSLLAGGTGLTLTAASHVVHFDRWWNPAIENQATDRAYRIGQTQRVLVHRFICPGTVEDRLDTLIKTKQNLATDVIDGAQDLALGGLSDAELLAAFSLDGQAATTKAGDWQDDGNMPS